MSQASCAGSNNIKNIFVSTKHRDRTKYPSAADFVVDIPVVKQVTAVSVKNFKYTPEKLVNNNNNQVAFQLSRSGVTITGVVYIPLGDYNGSITDLIAAINDQLDAYDVQFAVDAVSQRIQFTFAGPYVTEYFSIANCRLLNLLGYASGICLYRTGQAPSPLPSNTDGYDTIAIATSKYKTHNDTDLILRIADLEAILSSNSVCDRATAIIMSSRDQYSVVENTQYHILPLLQIQHRLQQLRVQIYNSDGDFYDLDDEDASFMLEFHCQREGSCI